MINYMPFNNELLVACQFLDPKNVVNPQFEGWVKTTVDALPRAVKKSEMSNLEVEVRLLQGSISEDPEDKPEEFWKRKSEQVPHLSRLARQAMLLPHGNAEVEHVFSMLPDIVTKKRSRLSPTTICSLMVIKSFLQCNAFELHRTFQYPATY